MFTPEFVWINKHGVIVWNYNSPPNKIYEGDEFLLDGIYHQRVDYDYNYNFMAHDGWMILE